MKYLIIALLIMMSFGAQANDIDFRIRADIDMSLLTNERDYLAERVRFIAEHGYRDSDFSQGYDFVKDNNKTIRSHGVSVTKYLNSKLGDQSAYNAWLREQGLDVQIQQMENEIAELKAQVNQGAR